MINPSALYAWVAGGPEYRERQREIAAARRVARELRLLAPILGYTDPELDQMSDEELVELMKESSRRMAQAMQQTEVTAEQASQAFEAIARAPKEADPH